MEVQERNERMFAYLSAMLPYGLKCCINGVKVASLTGVMISAEHGKPLAYFEELNGEANGGFYPMNVVMPYLRGLETITENEDKEIADIINVDSFMRDEYMMVFCSSTDDEFVGFGNIRMMLKYLMERRIDCFNMISKGLALSAPENMYSE